MANATRTVGATFPGYEAACRELAPTYECKVDGLMERPEAQWPLEQYTVFSKGPAHGATFCVDRLKGQTLFDRWKEVREKFEAGSRAKKNFAGRMG